MAKTNVNVLPLAIGLFLVILLMGVSTTRSAQPNYDGTDSDATATELTDSTLTIANYSNIAAIAIFDGSTNKKETSTMRHKLAVLPAKSFAKIEFMQDEVLTLDNEFKITFFIDNTLYEKTFLVKKNTVSKKVIKPITKLNMDGLLLS